MDLLREHRFPQVLVLRFEEYGFVSVISTGFGPVLGIYGMIRNVRVKRFASGVVLRLEGFHSLMILSEKRLLFRCGFRTR